MQCAVYGWQNLRFMKKCNLSDPAIKRQDLQRGPWLVRDLVAPGPEVHTKWEGHGWLTQPASACPSAYLRYEPSQSFRMP